MAIAQSLESPQHASLLFSVLSPVLQILAALGIGLIDTYGGLKTAIALAVDKADLGDNYRVTEVTETPTGFAAFIASLNMSVREAFTRSELGLMMKDYNTVREAFRQQGVLMYSPYKVEIR